MTSDLDLLRKSLDGLRETIERLEFEFVDDPRWSEPSDIGYLNDDDRANPDIMANVEATAATNELIAWFGRDQDGFVGLWRGSTSDPLERAPVVRLDTEGQYSLVAATVPDYFAVSVDEEAFDDTRTELLAVGFRVAMSRDQIFAAIDDIADPNSYRYDLYNQGRVRRGLEPI